MIPFTNDDLKRLKEVISRPGCLLVEQSPTAVLAILARLEAAEACCAVDSHTVECAATGEGEDLPRSCDCKMLELKIAWLKTLGE